MPSPVATVCQVGSPCFSRPAATSGMFHVEHQGWPLARLSASDKPSRRNADFRWRWAGLDPYLFGVRVERHQWSFAVWWDAPSRPRAHAGGLTATTPIALARSVGFAAASRAQ
jgi:hypothetical protein